jgi:hypothetical protein
VRQRIAFLKELKNHDQLQRSKRHCARNAFDNGNNFNCSIESKIFRQGNVGLEKLPALMSTGDNSEHHITQTKAETSLPVHRTLVTLQRNSSMASRNPSSLANSIEEDQLSSLYSSKDSRSVVSSRSAKIRSIFRRRSYSSSLIAEIQSVLNIRFSLSTLSSSRRASFSVPSLMEGKEVQDLELPGVQTGPSPSTVLALHRSNMLQDNAALIRSCCSKRLLCIHGLIKNAIIAINQVTAIKAEASRKQYTDAFTGERAMEHPISAQPLSEIDGFLRTSSKTKAKLAVAELGRFLTDKKSPSDRAMFGNTALFFAARSGAPIEILQLLLRHLKQEDIRATNTDGQTFLFFVDPDPYGISFSRCRCYDQPHTSGFECLIRELEVQGFDFDHTDHNGRHFLSYICASKSFRGRWLINLADSDPCWKLRLQLLSAVRDSSGSFLQDYMPISNDKEELREYMSSQFLLPSMHDPRPGDYINSRTMLHEYIRSPDFLRTATRLSELVHANNYLRIPWLGCVTESINKYDEMGYTPCLEFLNRVGDGQLNEETIVAKTRDLIALGANIHARARDGSTLLHLAAKKLYPKLLKYLLSAGIQANCRDQAGWTALDHVTQSLIRSTSLAAPVSLTARSFKAAVPLLGSVSGGKLETVTSKMSKRAKEILSNAKATNSFSVLAKHSDPDT